MKISSGKIVKAQKVVLYGVEGIGKSTFAASFPEPLFIDTEGSTAHLDVQRFDKPQTWDELLSMIRYVILNPTICRTLVIDTVDWAESLCAEALIQRNGWTSIESLGYGKGYKYLAEEFSRILRGLDQVIECGIHVLLTAHAKITKFEPPDELGAYDRWELKLTKQVAPLVKEWADMLLFANYETIVVNVDDKGAAKGKNKARGGMRVMYAAHNPAWDAKNRHGLDDKLPLLYASISEAIPAIGAPTPVEVAMPATDPPMDTEWAEELAAEEVDDSTRRAVEIKEANPRQSWGESFKQADAAIAQELEKAKAEKTTTKDKPTTVSEALKEPPPPKDKIPDELKELLVKNAVTVDELKAAVAEKGYYPKDTLIKNYDPAFVSGVLIGAWEQVFELIKKGRK